MRRLPSTLVAGTAAGFNALVAAQLALHSFGIPVDLTGGLDVSAYADAMLSHSGLAAGFAAIGHAALASLFAWSLHRIHAAEADRRRTGEWAAVIGVGVMAVEACAFMGSGSEVSAEGTLATMLLACLAIFLDRLLEVEDDPDDEAAFKEATVLGRGLALHALMFPQLDDVMLGEDRRS